MRFLQRKQIAWVATFALCFVIGGVVGANATISSNPVAYFSPQECVKGTDIYVTVDNAPTPNYFAVAGSGSTTISCGTVMYQGTNAATVINSALALGGHIEMSSGQFLLPASTTLIAGPIANGWLTGQGRSTNITTAANFAGFIMNVTGKFWTISNLGIDGRHQPLSQKYDGINLNSQNDTVSGTFISNVDHCSIDTLLGGNYIISGNILSNSNDGVCARGIGGVVIGNSVAKTTADNCYSLVAAQRVAVTGNACFNSDNYGIALEGRSSSPTSNDTISGNVITLVKYVGITFLDTTGVFYQDIVISGNTISDVTTASGQGYGIGLTGASISTVFSNIDIIGNTVRSTASYCLDVSPGTFTRLTIASNSFINCGSTGILISSNTATSFLTITGNNIYALTLHAIDVNNISVFTIGMNTVNVLSTSGDGMALRAPIASGSINGNTLRSSIASSSGIGIYLQTATYVVVSDNTLQGFSNGIFEATSSDHNNLIGNIFNSVSTPFTITGTHDIITENQGYNPVTVTATVTAGASVWTFTNTLGYDVVMMLKTAGGLSAESCEGLAGISITVVGTVCVVPPGGTMTATWTVTAPTYTQVPLVG